MSEFEMCIRDRYWTGNCQSVSVEDTDGVLKIDVDSQPMEGVMIDLSPAEAGGVDDTTTVVRVPASFTCLLYTSRCV